MSQEQNVTEEVKNPEVEELESIIAEKNSLIAELSEQYTSLAVEAIRNRGDFIAVYVSGGLIKETSLSYNFEALRSEMHEKYEEEGFDSHVDDGRIYKVTHEFKEDNRAIKGTEEFYSFPDYVYVILSDKGYGDARYYNHQYLLVSKEDNRILGDDDLVNYAEENNLTVEETYKHFDEIADFIEFMVFESKEGQYILLKLDDKKEYTFFGIQEKL